ncbi:MAG: hypothetical protein KJO95_08475 [Gammaproteobacteria bacterium]|nr:hypothetical protein [Gammaproteobacteria bacterium]
MDDAKKLQRHTELWKAGETSVRRIGIGGSIFALVVLLTVIEPFHIESADTQTDIRTQKTEIAELKAELDTIANLQQQLGGLTERIAEQPWTDEIEGLKLDFREGRVTEPRSHSNSVLNKIAKDLRDQIVAPLRAATAPFADDHPLADIPGEVDDAIANWLDEYSSTDWWLTTGRKDDTAEAIGTELDLLLYQAAEKAKKIAGELEEKAALKAQEVRDAESALAALVENLEAVMNRALPTWARGILSVQQLIIIFPWLLAGIAILLITTALRSSRHFHAMADGEGWSAEERRDPVLSTAWTVTPRGQVGSLASLATYAAVFGVLGLCVYRSQHPPETAATGSVQASVDVIASMASWSALLAYGLLVAAVGVVAATVFRKPNA